jgi:hypothetical protein
MGMHVLCVKRSPGEMMPTVQLLPASARAGTGRCKASLCVCSFSCTAPANTRCVWSLSYCARLLGRRCRRRAPRNPQREITMESQKLPPSEPTTDLGACEKQQEWIPCEEWKKVMMTDTLKISTGSAQRSRTQRNFPHKRRNTLTHTHTHTHTYRVRRTPQ